MNDYIKNTVLKAPGLAITGAASAIVKAANAFVVKAMGVISATISANQAMPGLATATLRDGTVAGNINTGFARVFTFLAAVSAVDGSVTYSVRAGAAFATTRPVTTDDFPYGNGNTGVAANNNGDEAKAIIGHVIVSNATGSPFVPGTTALDTGSLTVTYLDRFGWDGY